MQADTYIKRARSLVGVPFRLHGRSPETGLDCVGLVALAVGRSDDAPKGYNMRNTDVVRWMADIDQFGRRRKRGAIRIGEVLLLQAGPAQLHLGLWTGESLIHADARLRRVVETPAPLAWPIIASWTLKKG